MKIQPCINRSHSIVCGFSELVRRREKKLLSLMADAIAEGQQRVHKVYVLGKHRLGHGDLHIGEVPETTDTQLHKMVGDGLRHVLRHRQHGDGGMMLGKVALQLRGVTHLHTVDLRADKLGGEIKSGVEMEAHGGEIKVLHQGVT